MERHHSLRRIQLLHPQLLPCRWHRWSQIGQVPELRKRPLPTSPQKTKTTQESNQHSLPWHEPQKVIVLLPLRLRHRRAHQRLRQRLRGIRCWWLHQSLLQTQTRKITSSHQSRIRIKKSNPTWNPSLQWLWHTRRLSWQCVQPPTQTP